MALDFTLPNVASKLGLDLYNKKKAGQTGPVPVILPSENADTGSLAGTMQTQTGPAAAAPTQAAAPAPSAPAQTPDTSQPTLKTVSAPAAQGQGSQSGQPGPEPQLTQSQFANYLSTLQDKIKANNVLAENRAKLITALYDRNLTPDELKSLPPNVQTAIAGGDKRDIEMQIRLLNDQIQGRTSSLDQSVKFLSDEYDKTLADTEKQRQDAINNVISFVDKYGSNAGAALKSLYGPQYLDQLKKFGIDINNLSSLSSLQQQQIQGQYGGGGTGTVSIPANTLAGRNNNPGNLKYVGQAGATLGYQALKDQIDLDKSRGLTVDQFINKYAPPSENDTGLYIKQFTDSLGIPSNTKLSDLSTDDIAEFMAKKESGTTITPYESDAQSIADAIESGLQPPITTGLYKMSAPVRAELSRRGFDLAKAQQQWNASQAFIKTLNSSQMVRFNGLATSVVNTIDEVKQLADQMKLSGIPILNKVKLEALIQTQGNTPSGQLAARYLAAVNTLKEEFANLANGGYAPTEAAWSLANSQINSNYGVDQLTSSLNEVQRLINFRVTAINSQTPNLGGLSSPSGTGNNDPLGIR
jgi:hypothetical protein